MVFGLHLFTAFDTWWPNIEAAVIWAGPPTGFALWQHLHAKKSRAALHAKLDMLHKHLGVGQNQENTP